MWRGPMAGRSASNKGTLYFGAGTAECERFGCVQCRGRGYAGCRWYADGELGVHVRGHGKIDVGGNVMFTAASNLTNTGTFEVEAS